MASYSEEPNAEGRKKIERWQHAIERLRNARSEVTSAECELTNSANDLGRWLTPDDAEVGETIGVWYGDGIISAKMTRDGLGGGNFEVTVRKSGERARLRKEA